MNALETRCLKDWAEIAKEEIRVEQIKGAVYGFASELAVLRLLAKYRNAANARHGFSENLNSWYFSLEV